MAINYFQQPCFVCCILKQQYCNTQQHEVCYYPDYVESDRKFPLLLMEHCWVTHVGTLAKKEFITIVEQL